MPDQTLPDSWPTPEGETLVAHHETLVSGPPPPASPPPDRRIGAGMLLGLGVLLLVAAGILIAWLLTRQQSDHRSTTVVVTTAPSTPIAPKVSVPRFVGLKEEDALVRAGQVGLQPKEVFKPSKAPKGVVTSQNPPAGTELARGAHVTLVIDSSPRTPTPTTTTTAATTTATAPPQPQTSTMPDVTGQKEAAAVTALGNAGILPSIAFVPGTDPLGAVVGQAKPAGTTVPFHSHVQINVSRGPNDNALVSVPNVIGQALQDAVSSLNAVHLRLIYLKYPVTSRAHAGKIVQQSPLAGAQAPQNAQIVVYLGAYKQA